MPTRTEGYMQKYSQGQRIGDEPATQNIILPRDCDNRFAIPHSYDMMVGDKTKKERKSYHEKKMRI